VPIGSAQPPGRQAESDWTEEKNVQLAFAQTKIQPPRARSGLIARARLEGGLREALATRRLTLLQAPAGWGKTSALTRLVSQLPAGHALAWIAADEDDDVQRLLACMCAALEPLDLAWRVSPHALGTLALAERGLRQVADELVNALASAEAARGIVVIDDAHRIKDTRVLELLRLLLEGLPAPHWGFVLSTRTVPELPLARWRAQDELAEFRLQDLRFEEADVAALLAASGMAPGSAADLVNRTGGWAAGLRLFLSVGAAGDRRALASNQRHVFEYLADEVLAAMDDELRVFLVRCSLLPELTATRCAHVAQQPRAGVLLERVEREGLFVSPLDAEERTLRLHDLFRDCLGDRLQRDHAEELPALLRRAAEHEPDLARAVSWLARAGAWEQAAQALAARGPAMVMVGGGPTIERLLTQFPAEELEHRPALHHLRALCAYQQFDFEVMVPEMERAAAGYAAAGQHGLAALARAYEAVGLLNCGRHAEARTAFAELNAAPQTGSAAVLIAYFTAWVAYADHQPAQVAPAFENALRWLEQSDDGDLWEQCFLHCFLFGLPGMVPLIERFDASALRLTGDVPSVLRGSVMHSRAARAIGAGDLAHAAESLAVADEDLRWLGSPRALLTENYMLHMVLDALRGDREAVERHAQRMREDMHGSGDANRRTHLCSGLLADARARWALGDDERLASVTHELAQARNSYEWRYADVEHPMGQGMAALAAQRNEEAENLLRASLCESADEDMLFFRNSQTRLLLAEAQRRLGRLDAAAATLRPWLDSARRGGFVGGAMMAGRRVLEPLAKAAWGGRLALADITLLQRLCGVSAAGHPAEHDASRRPGGLTEREWQVLGRIAAGDSNKDIARALDLSLFTVKRHVANIFDKLALSSRTQAAVWLGEQR
jgi:LuxR family maltose regulon positive regulatory protein